MKKGKKTEPKSKPFATTPFKSLKEFRTQVPETKREAPPSTPAAPAESADDSDLFLLEMADVRRLGSGRSGSPPSRETPPPAARKIDEEERRVFLQALEKLEMDVTFEDELPEDVLPLKPPSPNRMRQLRRGAIRIDYELDLHGLTREEALENLSRFISGAYSRGQKAVLVITGKGNKSSGEPVLLHAVTGWLREQGKAMVAEFSPAPRQMGGGGAFVVFLKEKG